MPDQVKPYFSSQISIGNIIQIIAFIAALGMAWGAMRVSNESLRTSINDEVSRGMERDVRIRGLEAKAERADERYNSIMALLHRIDKSIERIGKGN